MLPALARRLRAELLEWSGAHARERARLDGSRAAVLMYHRVLPRAEARARAVEAGMFVTPTSFARQLDWLRERFAVLPLAELVARRAAGQPLPPGACAISFDDGWRDNLIHALPALAARALPATVFLVSRRVGTRGAFWPDEVCQRLARVGPEAAGRAARALGTGGGGDPAGRIIAQWKSLSEAARADALEVLRELTPGADGDEARELLDWEEVDAMARQGIAFESHAASHALLPSLPRAEAARELVESLATLRSRGHARAALLAYPNGSHDTDVRKLAQEAGYAAAFSTERGLLAPGGDAFALPRLGLHEDVSASRAAFHRVVPGSGLRARSA